MPVGGQGSWSELAAGFVIGGRYRVDRRIGRGAMGAVYVVQHTRTDERLALKVLEAAGLKDAKALERFRREACAPARIHSEHVVRVIDADVAPEAGGAPYIVMELLEGRDLGRIVTERGPMHAADAVSYLAQAADALDKAHAAGLVHRDLKPENLFLVERGGSPPFVKVIDFGLAKLFDANDDGALRTVEGMMVGTPAYMAPEQARGANDRVGPPADVWALGMVAFRLLTGQLYWTSTSVAHLVMQIVADPMPSPCALSPGLPPAFHDWFFRACARDASARFASPSEAVRALAGVFGVTLTPGGASVSGAGMPPSSMRGAQLGPASSRRPELLGQETRSTTGPALAPVPAPLSAPNTSTSATPSVVGGALASRTSLVIAGIAGASLLVAAGLGVALYRATRHQGGSKHGFVSEPSSSENKCASTGWICADLPMADPTRVDVTALFGAVDRFVRSKEPRAELIRIVAGELTRDGLSDVTNGAACAYSYVVPGVGGVNAILRPNLVVLMKVQAALAQGAVVAPPRCSARTALHDARAAGYPGTPTQLVYMHNTVGSTGPAWMVVGGGPRSYILDGATCAVLYGNK